MIHVLFTHHAQAQLKTIHIVTAQHNIPPGKYVMYEYYCIERLCGCQQVYLQIRNERTGTAEGVLSYNWATKETPMLTPTRSQGPHAAEWLALITQLLKVNERYTIRLKERHQMMNTNTYAASEKKGSRRL